MNTKKNKNITIETIFKKTKETFEIKEIDVYIKEYKKDKKNNKLEKIFKEINEYHSNLKCDLN